MDGLELIVEHGQLHERVEVVLGGVDELLEVREQLADARSTVGRRIDDLAGGAVFQIRAGMRADAGHVGLDHADDLDGEVGRKAAVVAQGVGTVPEGFVVMQHLLGVRADLGRIPAQAAVQLVARGEDVFDLRTRARLLDGEVVEQDRGVRHRARAPFQLGQTTAGADGGLQNCGRFEVRGGWEQREIVVGFGAVECGHAVDM